MLKFSDYFDTYAHVNPIWASKRGSYRPGFNEASARENGLIRVTKGNDIYGLYPMVEAECKKRSIDMPAVYLDTKNDPELINVVDTGGSQPQAYAIAFSEQHIKSLNKGFFSILNIGAFKQLIQGAKKYLVAHEIKHLYQDNPKNSAEHHAIEYDADRAGINSSGLSGGLYYLWFSTSLREFFTDYEEHPSDFKRLKAMREHAKTLEERACDHS